MNTQPHPNNPYTKNNQNTPTQNNKNSLFGNTNPNTQKDFLKGALIGAVATFILTNENAQRAIFKGFAKVSGIFEAGIEELKERYEDARAEVNSQE